MTFQKKSQLLEVIQEYKSDNSALKEQITELQKQLSSAESRICLLYTSDAADE